MSSHLNSQRASNILSLSADIRWKDLIDEIEDRQKEMDKLIHHPRTPFDMTQFYRGGDAFAQEIKDISKEAYDFCQAMQKGTSQ